uniref:Uncharacterized protein n=1 Tax=Arundo donax TaxID=35708 RepID=A0A0A9F5L7_ARUDO
MNGSASHRLRHCPWPSLRPLSQTLRNHWYFSHTLLRPRTIPWASSSCCNPAPSLGGCGCWLSRGARRRGPRAARRRGRRRRRP